ncbi:hypothetical protein COU88_03100 [Candidatus Roizmanbacteria bacterium CG10_big_fil_rev_8_21_14_0_10_39_6]|uniref:Uncharacterized protein n=1 Tax=Candidatus Roizmanbacteria bacterium CG10_big_fil_rev_8_21_14_0_10_39_6 TaxID=1974853 RepID=A0A2M8KS93_9BACT|nr:MAG: hypothetical protein COU88_03100 [Candidatus Roizmanbacteria bacterium CG10_big_fil_rev_8_21_14_0_10_39_6]
MTVQATSPKNVTRFVNLTPHTVVFQLQDGTRLEFKSEGSARVDNIQGVPTTFSFNGAEMTVNSPVKYGPVQGLPEPQDDVVYIVSLIALTQPGVAGRADVVAPATGPKDGAIRFADDARKGLIDAVTRWVAA